MPDAQPLYTGDKPVFDQDKITVVFVLGGPGAGKGTQCEKLVADFGFKHLSAGDLLRAEQDRPDSQYGQLIKDCIKEGLIVPLEVTIKLIENAMKETLASPPSFPEGSALSAGWVDGKGRFLIDGFPRKMDQALMFDKALVQSALVLFINTTEQVMIERVQHRSKTSGRADDNMEALAKRFKTFKETSLPVVHYYEEKGLVADIDSTPDIDDVYANVRAVVKQRLPSL